VALPALAASPGTPVLPMVRFLVTFTLQFNNKKDFYAKSITYLLPATSLRCYIGGGFKSMSRETATVEMLPSSMSRPSRSQASNKTLKQADSF
jgi:hypothetical protein